MTSPPARASQWPDSALLGVLTLLVWGLFAANRGLWRDDVMLLSGARQIEQAIENGTLRYSRF